MNYVERTIRQFLLARPDVYDALGEEIYARRDFPDAFDIEDKQRGVLFYVRGGGVDYSSHILQPLVDFESYGVDEEVASEVDRLLFNNLHEKGGMGILSCRLSVMGRRLTNPDTKWPFVITSYRFQIRNV